MNTSPGAAGISEDGTIVGTGIFNGQTHAYAAVLVRAGIGSDADCRRPVRPRRRR